MERHVQERVQKCQRSVRQELDVKGNAGEHAVIEVVEGASGHEDHRLLDLLDLLFLFDLDGIGIVDEPVDAVLYDHRGVAAVPQDVHTERIHALVVHRVIELAIADGVELAQLVFILDVEVFADDLRDRRQALVDEVVHELFLLREVILHEGLRDGSLFRDVREGRVLEPFIGKDVERDIADAVPFLRFFWSCHLIFSFISTVHLCKLYTYTIRQVYYNS